jgi:hypothetical protein
MLRYLVLGMECIHHLQGRRGRDRMELELQLSMQSVPITTNAVNSNPAQVRCTHTLLCGKVFVF